jgi:protein-S-isoprenylcysteine O-methyltransferase Ste14
MVSTRLALPTAALLFYGLAVILPALRVRRRTGVWPIVLAQRQSTGAAHQRLFLWLLRGFMVAAAGVLALYAVAGPKALGVVAAPLVVTAAGWMLIAFGFVVLVTAQAQMGASWRIGIDERATDLVTHGLYRLVRNPIYSAMDLLLVGVVLVAPSLLAVAAALGVMVALALQTRLEERHLVALHGSRYQSYAARVGRFLPGVGRLGDD